MNINRLSVHYVLILHIRLVEVVTCKLREAPLQKSSRESNLHERLAGLVCVMLDQMQASGVLMQLTTRCS